MKRATLGTCFTLLLFTAASAIALEPDEGPDYARNGLYVGVAGTYAFEEFDDAVDTGPLDIGIDVDDTLGMNARVGYRLHPYFATELEFEWLEGFGFDFAPFGNLLGLPDGEVEAWALTANGKGYLLTGPIQPFLLVGIGIMQAEADVPGFNNPEEEGFVARFGAGVDVYATEHFVVSLGADYVLPTGDIEDFDYVALQWGFQYRF